MAKRSKGSSYSIDWGDPDFVISDNIIIFRPTITIEGDFHSGVARLIFRFLQDRLSDLLGSFVGCLSPSSKNPVLSEEVSGDGR